MEMIEAVGTRIVLEKVEATTTTSSGIVLSSPTTESRGVVISIGAEAKSKEGCPVIGDKVIIDWARTGAYKFQHQGKELYIVDYSGIYAVEK